MKKNTTWCPFKAITPPDLHKEDKTLEKKKFIEGKRHDE